jgi:DNA-binding SARP family transcriptional activator/tetratricopeptide (TPR) repeat protein
VHEDIDIRLLGPLRVEVSGQILPVGGPRSWRVLVLLLLNANRSVATDRLVDTLWQDPPQSARQQIHNTIAQLRRSGIALDGFEIVSENAGYLLTVDEQFIDLNRFRSLVKEAGAAQARGEIESAARQLTAARDLWRGDAITGVDGGYFTSVSARLEEERLSAAETLVSLRIRLGESASVVPELTEMAASHPLREATRASLMTALYATGRQADALAVYDEGRRLLAEEHGLDPGDALRSLQEHILRGLPLDVSPTPQAAPAIMPDPDSEPGLPSQPERRSFLPHDPREFSGRDGELATLSGDSRPAEPTAMAISAINGMGGIGKTALAVHFAHSVAEHYPDGQYFVDLRGFAIGAEPLTVQEALRVLLTQSGVPDEAVPPRQEDRTNRWRSQMTGKRALIILDNAVNAGQLRPLLPGSAGSLVLVTSRRRLPALEGTASLALDVLPTQDAAALFRLIAGPERCEPDPDAVAEIVEFCGRLPLAVRIAAARFRERASWPLSHLRELLANQEKRTMFLDTDEGSVSIVLALSYRHLPKEHARLFRLLSLHPGPDFDAAAAAALADLEENEAQRILESLFDDNLVLEPRPGRYHFHDLIRDCATQLCAEHDTAEDRRHALERLVEYSLQCAATWCEPLARGPFRLRPHLARSPVGIPEPRSATHALELLADNATGLVEVARAALREQVPGQAWQLVCAMQPYFRHIHYTGAALDLFETASAAARRDGDERGESLSLFGAALALREQRRSADSLERLESAISISRRRGDRSTEMYQLTDHGGVMVAEERLSDAYEAFRSALTIVEELGDLELAAALKNNLGGVCRELGRTSEGYKYLTESLDLYEQTGRDQSEAYIHFNIGVLLIQEHRFDRAADSLAQARRKAQAGGHTHVQGAAEGALCIVSRAQGDLDKALAYGRGALRLAREHALLSTECDALNALGETHLAAENLEAADDTFRYAVDLARERSLRSQEGRALEGFAHLAMRRGDFEQARDHWNSALALHPLHGAEARTARLHLADVTSPELVCLRCITAHERLASTPR